MKTISLDQLKDEHLGKIGNPKRDHYEMDLSVELLSDQIKQLRKERKLTQEQLGKLIGVQRSQISKLENNTGNVTIGTILKIFRALKAEVNFRVNKIDELNYA